MKNHAEERKLFLGDNQLLARVDPESKKIQTLTVHLENVLCLAEQKCPLDMIRNMVRVAAILHDAGKVSDEFQEYMQEVLRNGEGVKRHVDHSSAGGVIADKMTGGCAMSQMIGTAIYSHHGLCDCIDFESGTTLSECRRGKKQDFEKIERRYFEICDKEALLGLLKAAHKDFQKLYQEIDCFVSRQGEGKIGDKAFYLGLLERVVLSVLIDSDWSDAGNSFSEKNSSAIEHTETQMRKVWEDAILNFNRYMEEQVANENHCSPLNPYRREISDLCYQAGLREERIYRLTVPTGAGKTFSSLRFALTHAEKYKKQRIFYVAPFNSILEQNASDIRAAVGCDEFVLEHHCNVIQESIEEEEKYRKLTESWDCPIVATTAVQMLNTLFSGQKSSIRRMHALCNSIIIFDEVQAMPVRCMELFHLAVNFLSQFCNTTVILCSATQPSLAESKENNIVACTEMAGDAGRYAEAFKRVELIDQTNYVSGGMQMEDLKKFALEQYAKYQSVLVIVNTKAAAKQLYEAVANIFSEEDSIYHLSTNMCPQNRRDELNAMKRKEGKRVFCVSTQLIEAGVNLSFRCVIRSLAGLDNIVQAAGRCNRHGKEAAGKLYIVKLSPDIECLDKLPEMKRAQEAGERLLYEFREDRAYFDNALDSQQAIKRYYQLYYRELGEEATKYPVSETDTAGMKNPTLFRRLRGTTLVNLLGKNDIGSNQYRRCHGKAANIPLFRQAFKTAGAYFKVISDDEKVSVVVPYNEESEELIGDLEKSNLSFGECKPILRKLQPYTLGISKSLMNQLSNAIYSPGDSGVLALNKEYYDEKLGVLEMPQMDVIIF